MNAADFLRKLRDRRVWVSGVLVNTTQRNGTAFVYQLREAGGSKVYLQFEANGWLKAMEYIQELNKTDPVYKWVVTGTVTIPCDRVNRTVKPPCGGCCPE